MTLSIEITAEQERAVSHILANDTLNGSNVGMTVEEYIVAELQSRLTEVTVRAERVRKEYIEQVMRELTPGKIATLAETAWALKNS